MSLRVKRSLGMAGLEPLVRFAVLLAQSSRRSSLMHARISACAARLGLHCREERPRRHRGHHRHPLARRRSRTGAGAFDWRRASPSCMPIGGAQRTILTPLASGGAAGGRAEAPGSAASTTYWPSRPGPRDTAPPDRDLSVSLRARWYLLEARLASLPGSPDGGDRLAAIRARALPARRRPEYSLPTSRRGNVPAPRRARRAWRRSSRPEADHSERSTPTAWHRGRGRRAVHAAHGLRCAQCVPLRCLDRLRGSP
jgi:hypothetical protein